MTGEVGDLFFRVPVTIEHVGPEPEYGIGAYLYARAGQPELLGHTLDVDPLQLIIDEGAPSYLLSDTDFNTALPKGEPSTAASAHELYLRLAPTWWDGGEYPRASLSAPYHVIEAAAVAVNPFAFDQSEWMPENEDRRQAQMEDARDTVRTVLAAATARIRIDADTAAAAESDGERA